MATQLQIVNKVLQRLRETKVTAITDGDYASLIAGFVNDAKEDLEDIWFWSVNETSVDTSITADGTRTYEISGTTDRSFLVRTLRDKLPVAFDATASEEQQLEDVPLKELQRWRNMYKGTVPSHPNPTRFAVKPTSTGRSYSIELEQDSSTARTWRTFWYVPQAELAVDGTAISTSILLPERPIYLQALFYALNERGEEMGEPGSLFEQKVHRAAAAAQEIDMQTHKTSSDKDMTNLEALRNHTLGI